MWNDSMQYAQNLKRHLMNFDNDLDQIVFLLRIGSEKEGQTTVEVVSFSEDYACVGPEATYIDRSVEVYPDLRTMRGLYIVICSVQSWAEYSGNDEYDPDEPELVLSQEYIIKLSSEAKRLYVEEGLSPLEGIRKLASLRWDAIREARAMIDNARTNCWSGVEGFARVMFEATRDD